MATCFAFKIQISKIPEMLIKMLMNLHTIKPYVRKLCKASAVYHFPLLLRPYKLGLAIWYFAQDRANKMLQKNSSLPA